MIFSEFILTLFFLPFFLLLGQPQVNHRNLSLLVLNDRLIPAATNTKGEKLGFEEQTYAVIYQVVNEENPLACHGVPIYSAYTTDLSPIKPPKVEHQVAIFPTRQGILDLLNYLKLTDLVKEYYNTENYDKDEPFLPLTLIRKLFEHENFFQFADPTGIFRNVKTSKTNLPAKTKSFNVTSFKQKKQDFQSKVKIRFGMLGGLHRTGTSCFFFAGEEPKVGQEMKISRTSSSTCSTHLSLSPDMVINIETPLTIIVPKTLTYTDEYMKQCTAYSYHIEERKPKSVKMTFRALSMMIMDKDKHRDITDTMRYRSDAIFTNAADKVNIFYIHQ